MSEPARGELTSWKDIADYLGVNVRTAQRWEEERDLPVHRVGGHHGRVFATLAELEAWKKGAAHDPSLWNNLTVVRTYAVTVTLLVLLGGVGAGLLYFRGQPGSTPSGFRLSGTELTVTDQKGEQLWRWRFPEQPDPKHYPRHHNRNSIWFGSLEDKQGVSTLFAHIPAEYANKTTSLYCFSQRGRLRWQFAPGRKATDGTREFPAVYHIRDFRVFRAPPPGGRPWIAVSSVHAWGHPCQVAILDGDGRLLFEYWHGGHLTTVVAEDLDRDGFPEILLAGVDHGQQCATLVVLDTRRVADTPGLEPPATVDLWGIQPGIEQAVVLFPRSRLNQRHEQFNSAYDIRFVDGTLQVLVREGRGEPGPYLLYTLDRGLRVVDAEASVTLGNRYREFKAKGLLDRGLEGSELESLRRGVEVLRH